MKKSFLVYLIFVFAIYVFAVLISGGRLILFADAPSFLLSAIVPLILMLGHYSPGEILNAFKAAGFDDAANSEVNKSLVFFRTFRRLSIYSGVLGVFVGFVMIFVTYPSQVFNENIGKYMAICILTVVYSLFIAMAVCIPFESALEKKLADRM